MERISKRTTTIALAALVLANLALDFGLSLSVSTNTFDGYLLFLAIGIPWGQILLLAACLSWAEGPWLARLGLTVLLTRGLAAALALGDKPDPSSLLVVWLLCLCLLFVHAAILLPLRRVRGWRLLNRPDAAPGERGRFRIGDLLLWMAVIAVPLTLIREYTTRVGFGSLAPPQWALLLMVLLLPPLLWLVLLASFAPRTRRARFLAAAGFYAIIATAIGMVLWYPAFPNISAMPGWQVLLACLALAGSFYLVVPLTLALNCLALRALGWRLVRPAWVEFARQISPVTPTDALAMAESQAASGRM